MKKLKIQSIRIKSLDYIVSRGEYLNAIVLAAYLGFKFVDAAEVVVFLEDGKLNFDETQSRLYKMLDMIMLLFLDFMELLIKGL